MVQHVFIIVAILQNERNKQNKRNSGRGNVPDKPQLLPLSKEARLSRMPQKPGDLVDALQDKIDLQIKRSRHAKAARSKRTNSGQ
ncbi:hypothetical protein RIVM261_016880 [Rivularia sp. IAM M-261]|nr:hypothetical protein RIVM261_016880 [Rivularia sp. IAM M-261]